MLKMEARRKAEMLSTTDNESSMEFKNEPANTPVLMRKTECVTF